LLSYLLYGLFMLSCLVLIVSVLLQPGKADAGSLFTSSISSTAFGPRGTQTILAKITIGAAATFFVVALLLGLGIGGQRSLMEGGVAPRPTPAPAASPAAPAPGEAAPAASPAAQPEGAPAATPAANSQATPAASPANR
jgi:protein translocase SecG subunit